jgi:hypothetical protein
MFTTLAFFLIAIFLMLGVIADSLWGRSSGAEGSFIVLVGSECRRRALLTRWSASWSPPPKSRITRHDAFLGAIAADHESRSNCHRGARKP